MATSPLLTAASAHKALAHPTRLRILAALRDGELCVCQLTALLALAPSTVSAHLAELRNGGLLVERRDGRWVHYGLAPHETMGIDIGRLLASLDGDPAVAADAEVVRRLRSTPVVEFCAGRGGEGGRARPASARRRGARG